MDEQFFRRVAMRSTTLLFVVCVAVLLAFSGCASDSSPTAPSAWSQRPELPAGAQWSAVGPLIVEPPSAPVGTYVTFGFNMTGPKGFCHEFFNRIKRPNGSINTELPRSPRFCSSNGKSGYSSNFKTDMPGWFEIAVEMYEYDGDQLRPDSPVVVRGGATDF